MTTRVQPTWAVVFLMLAACPLRADTVLLEETFEGAVGKPVNGWNGWLGDEGVVISRTVIDQGNSAGWAGDGEWPTISKKVPHTPRKGEIYVLTATLSAFDANGSYAEIRLATSSDKKAEHVGVAAGYRDLTFEQNAPREGPIVQVPQTAETMDVRMVVSDDDIACYYRNHGESTWTLGGSLKALNPMAAYNTVVIGGGTMRGRSPGGGIDSIQLTAEAGGSQPRASTPNQ
jgi:hypothetical protein